MHFEEEDNVLGEDHRTDSDHSCFLKRRIAGWLGEGQGIAEDEEEVVVVAEREGGGGNSDGERRERWSRGRESQ